MKQMVTRVPFLLFTSRLSAHFSGERPYQLPHIETKSTLSGRPIRQLTGDAPWPVQLPNQPKVTEWSVFFHSRSCS